MSVNWKKFAEWVGLNGPRPSNVELAAYIVDYVDNLEDRINAEAAAVLREAARVVSVTDIFERDKRQELVVDWGTRAFGAEHMADPIVRAARFFEEASELVQAVGLERDTALRAFDHAYNREPGQPGQEAGGVGVTLMALCNTLHLSADECEIREINRCLSTPLDVFTKRNLQKVALVDAPMVNDSTPPNLERMCKAICSVPRSAWIGSDRSRPMGVGMPLTCMARGRVRCCGATEIPLCFQIRRRLLTPAYFTIT